MGRIASIDNGSPITYTYDDYGQLIRENNSPLDKTFIYEYNDIGNIVSVKEYDYTTEALGDDCTKKTYTYSTSQPDQLTNFNGSAITYNAIGCPTSFGGYSASWTRGKLSKLTKGSRLLGSHGYYFSYNAYGERIDKAYTFTPPTMNTTAVAIGTLTGYNQIFRYDQSGRLIYESKTCQYHGELSSTDKIVYLYDANNIIGMVYTLNGVESTYYFQRNLLGDVIGIYDTNRTKVGGYAYDAWGNCTITLDTNGIATRNPIRYRGYYYDDDTKLYYLNARYYNPEWRRFISPDNTAYLDPESVNGLNLYCYCGNDPVNYCDPSGKLPQWAEWLIGGLVITGLTIATIATGGAAGGVAGFILAGALKGAVLGAVSGALISGVIGGISSTMTGDDFWDGFFAGAANGFMSGAIIGGITGAISSGIQVYNASRLWANTGNKTAYRQMVEHYQHHVINEGQKAVAKNIVKYSKDAYQFFRSNSLNAQIINAQLGVLKIAGAPGGIYNLNGLIRSFWYILK